MCIKRYIKMLLAGVLLASCSTTKFVADGDNMLNKVEVKKDEGYPDVNTAKYKSYVRQRGNQRWFSAWKVPLGIYSLAGRDTTKWLNRTLQSMGEAPVVFDTLKARQSCNDLAALMRNEGYLGGTVEMYLTQKRHKVVDATYVLHPGVAYTVNNVDYDIRDAAIDSLLRKARMIGGGSLKRGGRFDVGNLDGERKRITDFLVNRGYYRFNKDYITFRADTVAGVPKVDLTLVVHPYPVSRDSIGAHPVYMVRSVNYMSGDPDDERIHLRPTVLRNNTFITPGRPYSAKDLQTTYNRFGRLQAVKYTNISFAEDEAAKALDCNIQLTSNQPHSISFQPEGTNTAGDLGAAASLTYQHRNVFRGSELLSLELRGAYENIKGLEGYSNEDFLEYTVETKLQFPRFIAPFIAMPFIKSTQSSSELSLMYDLQNRPEYHRRVLSLAWKYKWNYTNHHDRYWLDLLDLNYVFMPWISDTFRHDYLEDDTNRNAILRYNYENLFIMKLGFGWAYNNGSHAIRLAVETAGNLLDLFANTFSVGEKEDGYTKIFDIAYAQYVKADMEYTKYIRFDYDNQLVFHAGLGIAYPYGNSTILPFEKRYFSGGANSVRGWSVRGLGPGSFAGKDGKIDFINQTGDMKIDLNMEYRARLFWKFTGALFVDAGNIWTLRNYTDQPGGQFRFDRFLKEIAVAYGLGLRLNFDFFILRFDFGMKAVNPAYKEQGTTHYPLVHPRLSRDLTFHFAVGLPF